MKLGHAARLCVASVLIPVALTIVPAEGQNSLRMVQLKSVSFRFSFEQQLLPSTAPSGETQSVFFMVLCYSWSLLHQMDKLNQISSLHITPTRSRLSSRNLT